MKPVILYCNVYAHEDFNAMVQQFHKVLSHAQEIQPNQPRHLYVDIEGHRNKKGGFDKDAHEFLTNFLMFHMAKFFSEIHTPLIHCKIPGPQDNNVPEAFLIKEKD